MPTGVIISPYFFYKCQHKHYWMGKRKTQIQDSSSKDKSHNCESMDKGTGGQARGINDQQLDHAVSVLSRLKDLTKQEMQGFKKNNPKVNSLFACMASLILCKKASKVQDQKQQVLKRKQIRKKIVEKRNIEKRKLINKYKLDSKQSQVINFQLFNQREEPFKFNQQLLQRCYVCRQSFTKLDQLYEMHCPECAHKEKIKRSQTADMDGLTALVTGGRIKIGYAIALKLLREGATVFVTSRFPNDALLRYQKQNDYHAWKSRLYLFQCDFMSSQQVDHLIHYIRSNVRRLDILINNAAQTLTRPKQFFTFELQHQQASIQSDNAQIVNQEITKYPSLELQTVPAIEGQGSGTGTNCVDLSQMDQFGQPLDLRQKNAWVQKIEQTSLSDCLSTQIVNSTVPFYLIGQLRSLMGGEHPSWVINVSSMEGVFYRTFKSCYHPHTNMAKASLNMITRTCSLDFSKDRIFMNSVDTGWVTNQNPYTISKSMEDKYQFVVPLDCLDGAMRVLDPIYLGLNHNSFPFGEFYKDYEQSVW